MSERESLRIGDFVLLKSAKFHRYLASEGILSENIVVNDDLDKFNDFLFCVHLQRQYSAAKELEDYTAHMDGAVDERNSKILKALQRGKDNENTLNDVYLAKRQSEHVRFGAVVQLFHLRSRKYLTVMPSKLAEGERENLSIGLDAQGSAFSWIQIAPRFKIDKEGDPIISGTEMYLKFLERPSEYIHCADLTPQVEAYREVNCSLEMSSWRMSIFQSSVDSLASADPSKRNILASQLVYINDPETKCNLTIARTVTESLDDNEEVPERSNSGFPLQEDYHHTFGDIVLEPVSEKFVGSGMLWFMESKSLTSGGPFRWKQDLVRFRHLNSGAYLLMVPGRVVTNKGEQTEEFALSTTMDSVLPNTLFTVQDLVASSKILSFDKPLRIGRDNIWLQRGETLDNLEYAVRGSMDVEKAVGFKIFPYEEANLPLDENGEKIAEREPPEVYSGISIRVSLQRYLSMTVVPDNPYVSTIWQSATKADLESFAVLMDKAVFFSQGFPISATNIQLDVDKADVNDRIRRQVLLRDQGCLEVLLRIINRLIPLSNRGETGPKLLKSTIRQTEEEKALLKMGSDVLSKCFTLVYWSVKDNPEIQMYVADYMPALLSHLGGQPLAGKCVTEMLASNMELQETKIGTREIAIFVEKLRSSKMNSMYLELLKSCCSCQDNGIDGNQSKVTEMLFSNTNDIIIHLHADYSRFTITSWDASGLYIPLAPIPGSPLLGDALLNKGLPRLSLSWTTNSIDFSPLGLFGKLSVDVEDLYKFKPSNLSGSVSFAPEGRTNDKVKATAEKMGLILNGKVPKKSAAKSAHLEQKASVAKYFVSQMFLCAEMCMDRNYIAMHTIDEMFPYEVLITMLKLDISDNIKAAAARVVLCLHVDRDPQAETKIPCLTRTWSDTKKSADDEPLLPFVDPARQFHFGLLQQIVADHIKSMAGAKWTDLSQHMLQLLKRMVSFNFYGTNDRMRDVIGPLIRALDRRHVGRSYDRSIVVGSQVGNPPPNGEGQNDEAGDMTIEDVDHSVLEPPSDPSQKWQRKLLNFLESLPVMCFVLTVVLVAVGVLIYQTITGASSNPGTDLFIFELIVLLFFIIEVGSRAYCFCSVSGTILDFMSNSLNVIDVVVIAVDIVFISLPPEVGSKGRFTKVLRLIRLIRLARIFRAARVIQKVQDMTKKTEGSSWKVPLRYSKAPVHELQTMVEAVEILALAQNVIEDRNLTLLLKYFYLWESGKDTRTPGELFEQAIEDSRALSLGIEDFDNVFIDVLMFISNPLVQSSLEILMAYHSTRKMLLENANQVQLLVSKKRERQFKIVDQMLQQLERNAETHELWGELKTEGDFSVSKQTKDIMRELTDMCKVRRVVLEFGEQFMADRSIQDLFRNLGCFNICFKILGLLDSVEENDDGEVDEIGANTRELCFLCNNLLYWFLKDNSLNQELGYGELDFFLDSLDAKINSHLVIRSIFGGNERLMKLVPHSYLRDMTEKICKAEPDDRSPYDLALMMSITHVEDKGMRQNQAEVVKCLTSPGRIEKIACFFVPITSPEYEIKRELMAPFLDKDNVSVEDLPSLLLFHLNLLEIFSGCTVGRIGGITTIEAKTQAIFDYSDVIDAMLDPGTLLVVKHRLALFLFNAVIEVEMMIYGLEHSASIWRLVQDIDKSLSTAKEDIEAANENGWTAPNVCQTRVEYHILSIMILAGFFGKYYDFATFRIDDKASSEDEKRTNITIEEINVLIISLYSKVRAVYDCDFKCLSKFQKTQLFEAIQMLQKSCTRELGANMPPLNLMEGNHEVVETEKNSTETEIIFKYKEFLDLLQKDPEVQRNSFVENMEFIEVLEAIPFVDDPVESDIRQEALFRKLVVHIRENMVIVNNERRLDARCTRTTVWIIRAFRTMIENRMGMSIYERDDEGGEEQDEAAAPVIAALNSCGATALALDLISVGIDPILQLEAVKLCVGLLFKEGGALVVQQIFFNHLSNSNSEFFFSQLHFSLQKLIEWHRWHDIIELQKGDDPILPEELIIVRFIQLMCEGHYRPNQDIMREQPNNLKSYNVLDDLAAYLACLTRIHCRTSTHAGIRVAATVLEVIQGPSPENQAHLTLKTELLETMNRLMRSKPVLDCVPEEEIELKKTAVDIFQALLEGQPLKSVIYERILSVIHLDVIVLLSGVTNVVEEEEDDATKATRVLSEDEIVLQTESMVLLQMLCDCRPSLRDEFGLSKNIEDIVKGGTACVEIIWNGDLQRRFFHVPKVCSYLAKSSMDNLVEGVDRSNLENQLLDFLDRARELYREVKHQEMLNEKGISVVFSNKNRDQTTWVTFYLTWILNILLISCYSAKSGSPVFSENVLPAFNALNYLQLIFAFATLLLSLVTQSPVHYQSLEAMGYSGYELWMRTATMPMTVYYAGYFLLSALGIFLADYYLSFLLLDILVKNSTTRDVMNAVVTPRAQLSWSLILGLFAIYIYSFYIFAHFSEDYEALAPDLCKTLWDCLKTTLWSISSGGGAGDFFVFTLGPRVILDITFFMFVMTILLNVIFGVIIDTFSSLREKKDKKRFQTVNYCFICGIEKQTFDRASSEGTAGFAQHVKIDHNMWNYLRFIMYIWEQDKDDDDGLEQFVRRAIDKSEIGWFPMGKAIRLDQAESEEDRLHREGKEVIVKTQQSLQLKIDLFQSDLSSSLGQLTETLIVAAQIDDMGSSASPSASPSPQTNNFMGNEGEDESMLCESSIDLSEGPHAS